MSFIRIAVVVIGRNEGDRLRRSLQSVRAAGLPVVYVDSGSTDGSCELAKRTKVPVIQLDPGHPFSAGRARNEGLEAALRRWPQIDFVMFLDGDCTLEPGFPIAAIEAFREQPDWAIVTGHLAERYPERSVYNRLCAIEWQTPAGLMSNMNGLGGIMAVRISAFRKVGGFNLNAIAGEEPDLGARLAMAGHAIVKIDEPMAVHDANMLNFRQWWRRAVRSGHAIAHRYAEHGRSELAEGRRELISALFWALMLPVAVLLLLIPTHGFSIFLIGLYAILGWRIYRWYRTARSLSASDAALMARFLFYAKFAELEGIARYCLNRMRGRFEIIEHK